MTINSKFSGKCTACGSSFPAGTKIEWSKGTGARHTTCPGKSATPAHLLAQVVGGAQTPAGNNRRAGSCDRCATPLAVGAGRLVRCHADTGCMQHFDDDGWHLYCLDGEACSARQVALREQAQREAGERKRAAEAAKIVKMEKLAAYKATRAEATLGLVLLCETYLDQGGQTTLATATDYYDLRLVSGTARGYQVVAEYAHSYDDDRSSVWGPVALRDELLDEAAMRIPMATAKDWLSNYRGCLGTDMYEYAAQRGE